ncbi:MAG: hypothetical protein WC623_07230 [Pedobacter sp.]|uniref:hypothetical protein n=1 Tax=Pedobacter sp. TaxID=1411316 RepID=UPI00356A83FE
MEIQVKEYMMSFDDIVFPDTLFKYRDWSKPTNRSIIADRVVYFAAPSSFEDQLDCKLPKRWDLLSYEDILDKYYQDSIENNAGFSIEEHMEFAIDWANNTDITNPDFVKIHQEKEFKEHDQRSGVLSLTEYWHLNDLWDKYADYHNGFCVGFVPEIMLRNMGTAGGKVNYYPELPNIYPAPKHSFSLQMNLQIFSKEEKWRFEQEYRTYIFKPEPLTIKERQRKVPAEAYKLIILGANMNEQTTHELVKSIPKELRHVAIKRATLTNGEIGLVDI